MCASPGASIDVRGACNGRLNCVASRCARQVLVFERQFVPILYISVEHERQFDERSKLNHVTVPTAQ